MSNGILPPGQGSGTGTVIWIKAAPVIIEVGEADDSVSVVQDSTDTVVIQTV